MIYSPYLLLHLLQHYFKHTNQINQIHSLLITKGYFLYKPTSKNSNLKWVSTLLYNTLIRAYLNFNDPQKSIFLFTSMLSHSSPPNNHTFPSLIKAISSSPTFASLGRPIQTQTIKRGLSLDPFILTCFVKFFAEFGDLREAQKVFVEITQPCIVSINSMLDAYGKNGDMGSALLLFNQMYKRDVVSWTSIIHGYGRNGCFQESLKFFEKMMVHQDVKASLVRPNEATFVSVLSSCGNLDGGGALYQGKQIHGYIIKNDIELTIFLGTALISMYGKTGSLDNAFKVFNIMRVKKVCTWNAIISGLACNGRHEEALTMFEKMRTEGVYPNEITFVAILSACARGKLVELGLKWFNKMSNEFGVIQRMEHYGCIVDLLGRAGLLVEAEEFIRSMPFEPDATVLGALLGACKIHGAVDLASDVGRRLLELQPQHSGRYIVLSNIYAEAGKWIDAAELRKNMVNGGIKKIPAHSSLESV